MPRNAWRYCELANKTTHQLYKVATPCSDDHQFKMGAVGKLTQGCSQIVLKCLYLARIGGPHILWSMNKLARATTEWTRACDKRLFRLISYIHHTYEHKQSCYVGYTAEQCRLGLFQDSDFAGDLEDSKSINIRRNSVRGMCKKQTSVSHYSTEAEVIPLSFFGTQWLRISFSIKPNQQSHRSWRAAWKSVAMNIQQADP